MPGAPLFWARPVPSLPSPGVGETPNQPDPIPPPFPRPGPTTGEPPPAFSLSCPLQFAHPLFLFHLCWPCVVSRLWVRACHFQKDKKNIWTQSPDLLPASVFVRARKQGGCTLGPHPACPPTGGVSEASPLQNLSAFTHFFLCKPQTKKKYDLLWWVPV